MQLLGTRITDPELREIVAATIAQVRDQFGMNRADTLALRAMEAAWDDGHEWFAAGLMLVSAAQATGDLRGAVELLCSQAEDIERGMKDEG